MDSHFEKQTTILDIPDDLIHNQISKYLLENNIDKIYWDFLSVNPNAIHLLEKNINKINWNLLSCNQNAIHLLEQNMDKIYWKYLSANPNAIHLLEKNMAKIDWTWLLRNPNLFELDYFAISKERTKIIEHELISNALHPSKVSKWLSYHIENGGDICDFEY